METINGIDLVLAALALGGFLGWRVERQTHRYHLLRISRGQCWVSDCILDAGHQGLHRD